MNDTTAAPAIPLSPHARLQWLAAETQCVAAEMAKSGVWDDSIFDAEEAADALVSFVGGLYAASVFDRAERAKESTDEWRAVERREAA